MSKFTDLLPRATEVQGATNDNENTAVRIGGLFGAIIDALISTMPSALINGESLTVTPSGSSITISFTIVENTGKQSYRSITIPAVSEDAAGLLTPSLLDELRTELNRAVDKAKAAHLSAESANASINDEIIRAKTAEKVNADAIKAEETRAEMAETELKDRIQGTSKNSDAAKDPFKFLGAFESFDKLIEKLDTLHNIEGGESSAVHNGHFRAAIGSRLVDIVNEVHGYENDVWSQLITTARALVNEVAVTEVSYNTPEPTHKYRKFTRTQKFETLNKYDEANVIRRYARSCNGGVWSDWREVSGQYTNSPNYGKRIALFGGSFAQNMAVNSTDYQFDYKGQKTNLLPYIADKLGATAFDDYAVGGQGMMAADKENGGKFYVPLIKQLQTAGAGYDVYIIMGGINDYGQNVPLGTSQGAVNDTTYCGGLKKAFDWIKVANPDARIYTITPFKAFDNGTNNHQDRYWNPRTNIKNADGHTFYEYVQAQKEVAQIHGVPCLDLWANQQFSGAQASKYYISDYTHPNGKGYRAVADAMVEFVAYGNGCGVVDVQALVSPKIAAETARAIGAETAISQNAIAVDDMTYSTTTDDMSLEFNSLNGESSGSVTIPAATTETAGVMSAEDKRMLNNLGNEDADRYRIIDVNGYVIMTIDAAGVHTPDVEIKSGKVSELLNELSKQIQSSDKNITGILESLSAKLDKDMDTDCFQIVDTNDNIILRIDADGIHTTDVRISSGQVSELLNELTQRIAEEAARAKSAEKNNADNIINEITRAQTAEQELITAIVEEVACEATRAKSAEARKLNKEIDTDSFQITDAEGNVAFRVDAAGVHTAKSNEWVVSMILGDVYIPTFISRDGNGEIESANIIYPDGNSGSLTITLRTDNGVAAMSVEYKDRVISVTIDRDSQGNINKINIV